MIPLKTDEERIEIIARLVYLLRDLRYLQREHEELIPWPLKPTDLQVWEIRTDEFLKNIGATEHTSLKDLIAELSIKKPEDAV